MAWAYVKQDTKLSATLDASVATAGNHIVVQVAYTCIGSGETVTVTDTAGNTYVERAFAVDSVKFNPRLRVFTALNILGHASNVIHVSLSTGGVYCTIAQHFSGPTAAFDTSLAEISSVAVTNYTTGSFNTAAAGVIAVAEFNPTIGGSPTFSAPYLTTSTPDGANISGYRITAGAQTGETVSITSPADSYRFMTAVSIVEDTGPPPGTVALTGVLAPGAVGTLSRGDTSFALSGVAAAGAVGDTTRGADLTGVQAGASVGAVLAQIAPPSLQVAAAGAVGAVSTSRTAALGGVAAEAAVGAVGMGIAPVLTQVAAAGAVGVVEGPGTLALSGVSAAGVVHSPVAVHSVGLSGNEAIGRVWSVQLPDALIGVFATTRVGTMSLDSSPAITGVAGVGAVGTVVALAGPVLTQVAAAGVVGSLGADHSAAMTQVAGVALLGELVEGTVVTGVTALGEAGAMIPDISLQLAGVQAQGAVGRPATFSGAVAHPRVSVVTRRDAHIFSAP